MEEDAARLLVKIVKTISIVIVWMIITMTIGIYFGWFFFYNAPTIGNIICYLIIAALLVLVLIYLWNLWKEDINS
jgi:membrane protein DedA with SNARE-associated domain